MAAASVDSEDEARGESVAAFASDAVAEDLDLALRGGELRGELGAREAPLLVLAHELRVVLIERLAPSFFDERVEPAVTSKSPGPGQDILTASANNLYADVRLTDLDGFTERHALNSRLTRTPTGLVEDRWVKSVEVREFNDIPHAEGTKTVGGRFVFHHMNYESSVEGQPGTSTTWPIHEIGRNPDQFPDTAGRLLAANSVLHLNASHVHANGHDTHAHLEFGFRFFPKGYQPKYRRSGVLLGNGNDLDIKPNQSGQEIHAFATLTEHTKIIAFEPHLHAQGVRMCLEAIWGMNIQQLTCVGYDHNWVKQYIYDDDAAPVLPKGTILHIVGYMNNSPSNKNVADPRNWQGSGNRSIANMFIDLGNRVAMTDEQFQNEMKARVAANPGKDVILGCPLCGVVAQAMKAAPRQTQNQGQQQ